MFRNRLAIVVFATLAGLSAPAWASTFSQLSAGEITPVPAPGVDALLGEAVTGSPACTAPLVRYSLARLGLVPGDEIDALSFGDDAAIGQRHVLTFSVDEVSVGGVGSGVDREVTLGTAGTCPTALAPAPPEATGDVFEQVPASSNRLAQAPYGYDLGPTGDGDEIEAAWRAPSPAVGPVRDDLDGLDYSEDASTTGIYFSLAAGSPSLGTLGVSPGDILWVLPGPITPSAGPGVAILFGVGPATDLTLGVAGEDIDALNLIAQSPGVIAAGTLGPSNWERSGPGCCAISSHLVQFSVAAPEGTPFLPGDVLTRSITSPLPPAAGVAGVHTLGIQGLELAPAGTDELNALEAYAAKINLIETMRFDFLGFAPVTLPSRFGVASVNGSAGLGPTTPPTSPTPPSPPHTPLHLGLLTHRGTPEPQNTVFTVSTPTLAGDVAGGTIMWGRGLWTIGPFSTMSGITQRTLTVPGTLRLCLFSVPCTNPIEFDLTKNGTRGIGVGGTVPAKPPNHNAFSLMGAPWTVEGVVYTPPANTMTTTTPTMTPMVPGWGFHHGPASLTSSTVARGGQVQIVTPIAVTSNVGVHFGGIASAHWEFTDPVPEPGVFWTFIAGAGLLTFLGYRRRK